jgi:hypothetical protein
MPNKNFNERLSRKLKLTELKLKPRKQKLKLTELKLRMRKRKLYLKSKLSSLHAKQESRLCSLLKSNLHIWTAPDLLGLELDILMTDQKREPILDHLVTTQLLGEISHISDSEIGLEAEEEDEEEAEDDHLTEVISHPFDLHKKTKRIRSLSSLER